MRPRRDDRPAADPQGAVARADELRAGEVDPIAEARLVERARIVRWLRSWPDDSGAGELADAIDEGAHLEVKP